ncbi:MAG: hypothetical protein ACQET7_08075 [Thermodesulfobacteriota bacterium]
MNITLLTKEYPPRVYGAAGVHVRHLAEALARLDERAHRVRVLCFGDQRERNANLEVTGVSSSSAPSGEDRVGKLFAATLPTECEGPSREQSGILHE